MTHWGARWSKVSAPWRLVIWLGVFLLLSRLLYLPWSQTIAISAQSELHAPANTGIVLEGVGQHGDTVLTLQFDGIQSVKLESPRAVLDQRTSQILAGAGGAVPAMGTGDRLSWMVDLPSNTVGDGSLRIELGPADGANLYLGTRDGILQVWSNGLLAASAIPQDYGRISGWLAVGSKNFTTVPDMITGFNVVPAGSDNSAKLAIAYKTQSLALLLGDPLDENDSVAVRSVALIDEGGQLDRRLCGAPAGQVLLWSALFQPRLMPEPPADMCRAGYLTASRFRASDGNLELGLRGTAFVSGLSGWMEKLKANIVLWPLIAFLIAIPGEQLKKTAKSLFARPKPGPDRVAPVPDPQPRRPRRRSTGKRR